ncbi:RNA polymerase, sigma 54 subunit, RpoN/SigL [Geosporobacter subterraneus DSM 17957]|uniref:RNA polymerase, sigma 54 subunit, RpoN/SigL n=1 Tax=Geosporobacter subterraneus DSM 17957 TaxID=1121919 RepID=A0A1M6PTY2_9FIRM|nr:RNA polymerase factor sigma-54 [Geosporobacter subterraneus]SHK11356.1 RNA polymerase, sigma 54 subunit, RpoN/SigL [Geosporobacter subterraneus DSM 17957]
MKIGFHLNIEQIQKLVMTPELKQAIQILQYNTQELNQFIDEQLLTNPVLDISPTAENEALQKAEKSEKVEKDEIDWKDYFKEYDDISYRQSSPREQKEDVSFEQFVSTDTTLTDHLLFQLQFSILKSQHKNIAKFIIESLDRNGYLTIGVEEIAAYFKLSQQTVENILSIVQTFDPPGIAARDLKECLLIQLKQKGVQDPKIIAIVTTHLDDLAENRLANISKDLNISPKEVQEIADFIKTLEPKPGRVFSSGEEIKYITPDVSVEKIDGEYVVIVNDSTAPRLSISAYYKRLLMHEDKDSNTSRFLTDKLNSAMWLIKSIEQRRQTIYKVVKAIVEYQLEFFENGKRSLKPLTLKQIAEEVGVHESTVSRAVNGKYMQTPRGTFEIKFFFTSGVSNQEGEGIASESIKSMIKEMIEQENHQKPLSDQAIAEELQEKGINISRRTVAKYRDEMNILSSSKRKRY